MNDNRKNGGAGDKPVSLFDFKGHKVRVVESEGEPWFVAMDVCGALGLTTVGGATRHLFNLNQIEVDRYRIKGQRGGKPTAIVSESGLYKLVMRSDKPEAKGFQDWVTKTVLPAIRKDGGYIAGEEFVATGEMDEDELVLKALEVMQGKIARLTKQRDSARATVTEHLLQVTVDEWRALSHVYLRHGEKTQLGRKASRLMRERGLDRTQQSRLIRSSEGEREVFVNVYPKHILDEVAGGAGYLSNAA